MHDGEPITGIKFPPPPEEIQTNFEVEHLS